MNTIDASNLQAKHYPGGIEALAVRLGKSAETLRKELDGHPSFKLGLLTAVSISEMCIAAKSEHCMAFVNAITSDSGGFVRLPVVEMDGPVNLQRSMSDVIKEMSDVSVVTIEGDADGTISDNDLERGLKEINEARAALQRHEQQLRVKNAASKPTHLRAA